MVRHHFEWTTIETRVKLGDHPFNWETLFLCGRVIRLCIGQVSGWHGLLLVLLLVDAGRALHQSRCYGRQYAALYQHYQNGQERVLTACTVIVWQRQPATH